MENPFKNIFAKKEEGPEVRVVGGVSEEGKEQVKKETKELLGEKHLEHLSEERRRKLEALEYPKTEEEKELISFANKKINELMEKSGISSYDIPEANIHILPPDLYKEIDSDKRRTATSFPEDQVMFLNANFMRNNPVLFGGVVFHELMHLKSHLTLEAEEEAETKEDGEKKIKKTEFRSGLEVEASQKFRSRGKYHEHFCGLNEALISSQEKAFYEGMMKLPLFAKERERLVSPEVQEIKKRITKKDGILEKDIIWVRPDGKNYEIISYPRQRAILSFVVSEIQEEFSKKYETDEDVLQEFLKGFFNGKILTIARLVEKTFGKGSFRVLGMMNDDKETPITVWEYLEKARTRQLKLKQK